jgi:hypothetical protein
MEKAICLIHALTAFVRALADLVKALTALVEKGPALGWLILAATVLL